MSHRLIGQERPKVDAPSRGGATLDRLGAHQPFDLVQPAAEACRQHVVPDPPGAIGAIALQEARPHLGSHLFIRHSTGAGRSAQPSMKARARDAQR